MPDTPKGLWPALLAVQAEAPTLQKSAINPHFHSSYVPLDKLHETVIPLLNKHGLVWVTYPVWGTREAVPCLVYRLRHVDSGEELGATMLLMIDKANPQGQGSAITYARRYALMAVLGLVADEDDDGNKASKPSRAKAKPKLSDTPPSDFMLPENRKPLKGDA